MNQPKQVQKIFSFASIILGVIALVLSLSPSFYTVVTPTPVHTSESAAKEIVKFAKTIIKEIKNKKESSVAKPTVNSKYDLNDIAIYGTLCLGGLGILMALIAYVREESRRFYIAGSILCIFSMAISYSFIILGIIFIGIVLKFLADLGLDFG